MSRWDHLPGPGGYDPGPWWQAHLPHPAWLLLPAGAAGVWAWRRPLALWVETPWLSAWSAYTAAQLGVIFWMIPFGGLTSLAQQWTYSLWMLGLLAPWWKGLDWRPRPGWWKCSLAAYGLALLGAWANTWLFHPPPSQHRAIEELLQSQGLGLALWLLQLCLVTPLLEEGWYRMVLGGRAWRWVGVALLFSVVHVEPYGLLPLFWLGILFQWARLAGGYPAAVLAHGLWNATVAAYLLIPGRP